jgi:hypothetical protein
MANPDSFLLVDVQDSTTVTFDSYKKRIDKNGNEVVESEHGDEQARHRIDYCEGIKTEHLSDSMSHAKGCKRTSGCS